MVSKLTLTKKCPGCLGYPKIKVFSIKDYEYNLPFEAKYNECNICKTVYQLPMPASSKLSSFYPRKYHSFSGNGVLSKIRMNMRVQRISKYLLPNDVLLDFGCGNGDFIYFASKVLPKCIFFGYEISDKLKIIEKKKKKVTIIRGKHDDLWGKLPNCKLITMNHTIEHLPDPEKIIRNLHNKLNKKGVLDGQTPATDSIERKLFKKFWSGYHAPRHTVIFSKGSLKKLLIRNNFDNIKINIAFNPASYGVSIGSLFSGEKTNGIQREGLTWFILLIFGAFFWLIDLLLDSPGVINFKAYKR